MAPQTPRGLENHQEVPASHNRVDFRRPGQKFEHFMVEKNGGQLVLMMVLATMFMFPTLIEPMFVVGMLLMFWLKKRKFHLPLRMPKSSGLKDHNDPSPNPKDKGGPSDAGGIVFIGNEMGTNKELWVNAADAGTHFLVFGTTGAGKAIADDEPVHTPTGWVKAEDLKEGDLVSTADGRHAPIVGVFPQGEREMYRLLLDDGRQAEACAEHLWAIQPFLRTSPLAAEKESPSEIVATSELRDRLQQGQAWALPLPKPVENEAAAWGADTPKRVADMLRAIQGHDTFPAAPDSGTAAQRLLLWTTLLETAQTLGLCRVVGRAHHFQAMPEQANEGLLQLARSVGRWAKSDGEDGSLLVIEEASHVRVLRVERTKKHVSCRCIKIDDPQGLFLVRDYIVTHNTEALISMAYNALVHGSGFIYVDGKGDNSLFMKLFSMTRAAGRHDDLLCINYMTGGRDVVGPQEDKMSNNLNPFITGTAGSLTQLLVSLMPTSGGDNAMWQGRAVAFIGSLMMALTHLRDEGLMQLGVAQIRENLTLDKVQELAKRTDLTPRILTALDGYLHGLPGYVDNPPDGKQGEITNEQHGYLQMQFSRIMGSLADDYGYIFNTTRGEVDFFDVVLNNRILTVLLPSLEKSPEELGNLGKIIVASLKSMMATGLGDRVEGDVSVIIDAKATNAPSPFLCILDEYGYYVVTGAAVMPAQARSLNFSMVFAGQDYSSFKKNNNKEEAEATVANCNVIVFMKTVDTADTADLFLKSVGKARVASASGYQRNNGSMGGTGYFDSGNAQVQMEDRGDLQDLRDQGPGVAHVIFKSILVRARMFYAAPPTAKRIRLNHFIRVEPASSAEIQELDSDIENFAKKLSHPDRLEEYAKVTPFPDNLALANNTLESQLKSGRNAVEASLTALMALQKLPNLHAKAFSKNAQALSADNDRETGQEDVLSIFMEADEPLPVANADPMAAGGFNGADPMKAAFGVAANQHKAGHTPMPPRAGDGPRQPTQLDRARPNDSWQLHKQQTQDMLNAAEMAGGADPVEALDRSSEHITAIMDTTEFPKVKPDSIGEGDFEDLLGELYNSLSDPAVGESTSTPYLDD